MISIVISTSLLSFMGKMAFSGWKAGLGLGALYVSLIMLKLMIDN